ncbi:PepSY domain-containing protein [Pigmentiphaga sp. GD03639]|uniref:PepSY-associated TM helix domain-containing protein n=1 Tax=Pigmentiphaga sp. GD03639 TaxID=2975354 RepID=UPI002449B68E|nr:PepSY-associated TM helix domain-containing protein [Pigmentiphaga sp. GD03639]MDH2239160.1 PepSY domain-containing protein [Pigmentiphaga sp. GD03639]
MPAPHWPLRTGLAVLGAPAAAIGLAIAIARRAPLDDALDRLYAGMFIGVLAQLLLLGGSLLLGTRAAVPMRRAVAVTHAWAGMIVGLVLFVVCLTGVFAVLKQEVRYWEMPSERQAPAPRPDLDALLHAGQARFGDAASLMIQLPDGLRRHAIVASAGGRPATGQAALVLRADDARPMPATRGGAAELLVTLHNTLHAGFPGRVVVSLFGFALAFLVVGGVANHPRRSPGLLRLRIGADVRTLALDVHKLLGLWLSPLLLLIAVTGIFSGLGALATVNLAPHAFPDDPRRAMQALMDNASFPALGQPAAMSSLNALVDRHRQAHPGFQVESVAILHWGDAQAYATLRGHGAGQLSTGVFERFHYRLRDGALLRHDSAAQRGPWTQAFIAIQPLHFAQYGGTASRWLHAAGGMAAALLAASGTWLWLRRRATPDRPLAWPRRIAQGVCLGLTLSCSVLLAMTCLTPDAMPDRPALQAWALWGSWLASAAGFAWPGHGGRRTTAALRLAGLLLWLAAIADLARQAGHPLAAQLPALAFDLLLILAGTLTWRLARFSFRHPS